MKSLWISAPKKEYPQARHRVKEKEPLVWRHSSNNDYSHGPYAEYLEAKEWMKKYDELTNKYAEAANKYEKLVDKHIDLQKKYLGCISGKILGVTSEK